MVLVLFLCYAILWCGSGGGCHGLRLPVNAPSLAQALDHSAYRLKGISGKIG